MFWWKLPAGLSGVSRATAHRRFTEWTAAGLWERLHHRLLNQLGVIGEIDWSRAVVDSIAVRAEKGTVDRPDPGRSRQARLLDADALTAHVCSSSQWSARRWIPGCSVSPLQ